MKNEHLVPLSNQSLDVLHGLKAIAGDSRYVFPGGNRNKPISNNTMLFALYRLGYKGKINFPRPGKPTDNAFCESFNGTFRSECLDTNWFSNLDDARQLIQAWRRE